MDNREASLLNNIEGQSQLLIAALAASISGITVTDWQQYDNPIIYCNRAFEEMTGYTQEEILGRNCRFLQADNREQIGRYKLQEALSLGNDCHVEIANYRKDGTMFYNELYVTPIKNNDGIVTHYVGIQNDITIRKQKEISLLLEQANIKKLQDQKDEFTSLASHQLKTPITSLLATLQLMNQIVRDDPQANGRLITLSKNAERNTVKLNHLVNDLLNTTRIIREELPLNKTTFTFSEIMEGCCSHLYLNGTHDVKKVGDTSLKIYGDQHKLDQVMINLIDNAVRYAPQSREIMVEVERIRNLIKVSVADKGRGITEEQIPYLFLRHKSAESTLANRSGLGLGLYICSEIIRRHGGEMGVESEQGKGSKFWFTLPDTDEPKQNNLKS